MDTTAWSSSETVLELEGSSWAKKGPGLSSWEREASRREVPALSMMALAAVARGLSTMAQVGKSSWAAPELEQARSRMVPWALVPERSKMGLVESSLAVLVPNTTELEWSSLAQVLVPSMREQEENSWALVLEPSMKELEGNNLALEMVTVLSKMGLEVNN